jgi:DivIVA domain-containing protein
MFWFQLVVVLLLLAAVGWLAVGGGGHMSEPVPDRADLALPDDRLVAAPDLDRVRFSVGLRGYRMEEVDDVLDRLAREVALRDQRIADLEGRSGGDPAGGFAAAETDGAEIGGEPGEAAAAEAEGEGRYGDLSSVSATSDESEVPAATAGAKPESDADLPPLPQD